MFAEFTKTVHHEVYPPIDPKTTLAGSMKDKNIVITGAGRGIGRAIAQSFATAGAKSLFLISRTDEQLLQTKNIILAENPDCVIEYIAGSIVDESTVKQIFTKAGALGPLDILVNCAGTSEHYAPLAEIDVKTWWSTIETNLLGTFLISTHFLNAPNPPSKRVIINIGSNASIEPMVIPFQCPSGYTIGKTGFLRLSQYLHAEYSGKGVNTYLFHPGGVLTELLEGYMPPGSVQMAVDSPFLAGGMAVWFAAEVTGGEDRGWLGGRYISAVWDVNEILERKQEIIQKDLFKLRLDM